MAEPIWKDYYVTLGTNDSYQYEIRIGDKVVYAGMAYKRPNMGYVAIKLNDIVADYLSVDLKLLRNDYLFGGDVFCEILVDGDVVATVTFYADWSYDVSFNLSNKGLSDPINSRVMLTTPVPYSSAFSEEYELETKNGLVYYIATDARASYCMFDLVAADLGINAGEDVSILAVDCYNTHTYHVVDSCAKYALYYVNAYGGVDMLLIEGNHSEEDSLTRHTRSVEYDNREVSNRGRSDYAVELTKTLTLHTSWLSDDEASRMHHLLNSPQVCLFDIEHQQMIPVVLKNKKTEYKTFKGKGGKLVNYAIDVEFANEMLRK